MGMWVVHVVQVLCLRRADMLWMSVVRGMSGVGISCGICVFGPRRYGR